MANAVKTRLPMGTPARLAAFHWALGTGHLIGELSVTADLLGTELVEVRP